MDQNLQNHELSQSLFLINVLSHEFLYGNIKPMDTYAPELLCFNTKPMDTYTFGGAFSHEVKFQFLDGAVTVPTRGWLFLLDIKWKFQDKKAEIC